MDDEALRLLEDAREHLYLALDCLLMVSRQMRNELVTEGVEMGAGSPAAVVDFVAELLQASKQAETLREQRQMTKRLCTWAFQKEVE